MKKLENSKLDRAIKKIFGISHIEIQQGPTPTKRSIYIKFNHAQIIKLSDYAAGLNLLLEKYNPKASVYIYGTSITLVYSRKETPEEKQERIKANKREKTAVKRRKKAEDRRAIKIKNDKIKEEKNHLISLIRKYPGIAGNY